ncbi:MAG: autotransporter-associated beta strand repeat-containing protein [Gemmataceae bacterium]
MTSALGMGAATNPLTVNNPNVGAGTDVVVNLSSTAGTTTGNLNGTLATPGSGTNTATINTGAGQTFTVNQTAAGSFDGVIGGTGNFALGSSSTNTLTLNGSNTYTGTTTLSGGTLSISNLQNGGVASNIGTNSSIILDGGNLLYTGASQSTDRVLTLTNNGGTINSSGTGVMTFSNSSALGMTGSSPRTLTLTGTTGTTTAPNIFAGSIVNGAGTTSLTKSGTGVWNLTGASTYTGATNINAGTLVVSGTTGTSTFNVNNSGTLTGTGTIGGQVNVNVGGTIAPGDGTNPLTVNNNVTINGTYNVTVDVGSSTNSRLVSNSLTLNNATLNIDFTGTLTGTEVYVIAQNQTPGTTAVTGTFAGLPNGSFVGNFGGHAMYIYYNQNVSGTNLVIEQGTIVFTPVPEPVSVVGIAALAVGCVGGVLRRRARRANSVAVVSTPIA